MSKKLVRNSALIAAGTGVAFGIFWLTSHPKSKIHHNLPQKKYKNLYILPNVKIVTDEKTYHVHHWATMGVLYWTLFIKKKKFSSKFLHGIMLGSIIQGLTYKDRFQFTYKTIES